MERGVYFDAWYPRQHCYHPSLPPRRLRMVDDLVDYRATVLVWSALGGGSLSLPYLEQEAFGDVGARARFYGFVNDAEFIAACQARGIKVLGIVFEAQGWEFPVELDEDETTVLALNELRGVGRRGWLGLREFSSDRYPRLWPSVSTYFPDGLVNSDGEPVTDLIEECVARDIHGNPCHARWVECPDREHQCFYMDRNNPVWREYLKAVIRIQVDAGVDGVQLDEAELPMGAMQYGACFCRDCTRGFREHLRALPADRRPGELDGVDLATFEYGPWLLERGHDFRTDQKDAPLFGEYYAFQCRAIATHFAELAEHARAYGRERGREVLVSGNFFNLDAHYLPLAEQVDLIVTEMRNTTYRQPEWYRYAAGFARLVGGKEVVVVENPYGGVVPELVTALSQGRGHDLMRLSLWEAAAFGVNMTVPYGSWMGATLEDSFWAPHELLVQVQDFVAATDGLRSGAVGGNELAVVHSVPSLRDLVARADASDNLRNARDTSVVVPYRVTTEALSQAGVPFDVVVTTDGELQADRLVAADLAPYRVVVLPGCWWLTEQQVDVLVGYLDGGGRVVVTEEPARNLPDARTEALRRHPSLSRAALDDTAAMQPDGPQVRLGAPLAVNLHLLADGSLACHLVDHGYDERVDAVPGHTDVALAVRVPAHLRTARRARVVRPGEADLVVPVRREGDHLCVELPRTGVYTVVVWELGEGSA
ncbi:hypothetical protein [Desertihabitans brevis]|uniref:hypothetical protein n=1 Tax=Desertihabitans brevis TaxID=2268447 RepID=UPI00131464D2|nr:hypothetical protein [Desertihabitans brevis]